MSFLCMCIVEWLHDMDRKRLADEGKYSKFIVLYSDYVSLM